SRRAHRPQQWRAAGAEHPVRFRQLTPPAMMEPARFWRATACPFLHLQYAASRDMCLTARQFMSQSHIGPFQDRLGDFTASPRLLMLSGMALVAGAAGTLAAFLLIKLIALCTNLAYYQSTSLTLRDFPAHLPLWSIGIPV